MSRIIGIDLGTTNSLVGYVDERTGLPRVIPDAEGRKLLPSIVSFAPAGVLAAEAAKIRLSTEERTRLTIPFDAFTYRCELTRADLERLIGPLVARTLGPCRAALADAALT